MQKQGFNMKKKEHRKRQNVFDLVKYVCEDGKILIEWSDYLINKWI